MVGLVILGSVRGALVIHLDFRHDIVYPFVSGVLLIISLLGVLYTSSYSLKEISVYKYALFLNVMLFMLHIAIYIYFYNLEINIIKTFIFFFIPPYILLIILHLKEKHVETIILIITLFITYSVFTNFIEMLKPGSTIYLA